MKLIHLTPADLERTMDLFCSCFRDDGYYLALFSGSGDIESRMRREFSGAVGYCLASGSCLGVEQAGKLTAFFLCFEYTRLREDEAAFSMIFGQEAQRDAIHSLLRGLPGKTLYCLSVAVDRPLRRKGIASALLDAASAMHPDWNVAGDVSNEGSLEIYRRRGFRVTELEKDYFLVYRESADPGNTVQVGQTVRLLLPETDYFAGRGIELRPCKEQVALCGYEKAVSYGVPFFRRAEEGVCFGTLVELDYSQYLAWQRLVNVSHYDERAAADYLFYSLILPYDRLPLMNTQLQEMLPNRQREWGLIPDIYVSIPVSYSDIGLLLRQESDSKNKHLLQQLDFRTHYEAGIPSKRKNVDGQAAFKGRIQRRYLGKLPVQICGEVTSDSYEQVGQAIGQPAWVDLYISVDTQSSCAVLTWYSLSAPFLTSHLLDNVIRNQLMVMQDRQLTNFYEYISHTYGITKQGTAKMLVVIPQEKSCLDPGQVASLLAAETIYPDGESFGSIIEPELIEAARSAQGMGQYDRAWLSAYTNVMLQFDPDLRCSLMDRLAEESIPLFFIELLLMEEAAIQIADKQMVQLLASESVADPVDFLKQVDGIYDKYSRTIDFWDIQMNYPTSQKSMQMLRRAFRIQEQLERMQRNQSHLERVFDIKCDIVDRREGRRMDTSLALISLFAIFSAWVDSHAFIATWSDLLQPETILLLQRLVFTLVLLVGIYAVVHLFGGKVRQLLKKKRRK